MIEVKSILVATDFSDHARVAMRYGAELAHKFGAEVIACHIVAPLTFGKPFPGSDDRSAARFNPEVRASRARELAEEWFATLDVRQGRVLVELGHPFVEIVRIARNENVDLVVIGTHGRGAVAHMLLGSVAEKVVRTAPCPVLTVRQGQHEFVVP